MYKEIEKYVGLYILAYIVILVGCGFFEYMANCQGKSLECAFDKNGFYSIVTATAYVITPIVAISGFLSWKEQKEYEKEYDKVDEILNIIGTVELNIKSYLYYIEYIFCTLKKEKNLIILDESIIDLSFHQKFNEEFNLNLKILNIYYRDEELKKLADNYHEKVCKFLSIPLQLILSQYLYTIKDIAVNKPKYSIVGIQLSDTIYKHVIEIQSLDKESFSTILESENDNSRKLDYDFFNDFILEYKANFKNLEKEYSNLIDNESKILKSALNKIKTPCSN